METKQKFDYVKSLKNSLGYDEVFTVEPIGLSGGLAVFWKKCFKVDVLFADKRVIDLKIAMGSINFYLSCVYGDPIPSQRNVVWNHLSSIGVQRRDAWALLGDFNELLNNNEKRGGAVRSDSSFWDFRNMVENCKIKSIRHSGNAFSWAGWRDRIWVQCRLDRAFGNDEWCSLFPRTHLEYMDMLGSDHRPILLHFALDTAQRGRGRFYMDKRLFHKQGFKEAVSRGWSTVDDDIQVSVMDRISRCRAEISIWKRHSDSNSLHRLQRLKRSLEEEIAKLHPNRQRMLELKKEIALAHKEEEVFWKQKSRDQWLREGDKNTKYFHNCVQGRKVKNRVLMLLDDNNREQFTEGSKGSIAANYFMNLFKSSNPTNMDELFSGFATRVTPQMNALLTGHVSAEEIKGVSFSVNGESAPGADGFTSAFYRKCWGEIGPCITKEVQRFFATALMPPGWNHTQISLLPKISNPTKMTDMRPISLCSVHYKIISKILCSRLKSVLEEIISPTQGAFVSDRLITDNILIAHELIHALCTNESISEEYMAIKTDMSKAYDRVEWTFLREVMKKFGFDETWIKWIMACVSSVTYTVLMNGCTHGFIKPERGIRQGDPLSPFLFIICVEALVHTLNKAESDGLLSGLRLSENGPYVHHLLFADDSLLLCKANADEALTIKNRLKLYGEASGQLINTQKSSIIFGKRVPYSTKQSIKGVLEIDKEGGEGTYLGLPECFKGSKVKLLNFSQEKLQSRLNGWFAKTLSQGGKEILLKSIALALPVFAMSVFKLPINICKKLTSAMTMFWWSNVKDKHKISWVSWQKLCQKKMHGGLGFHDIGRFNQALLAKQAWRIYYQPETLVSQVLKSRYFNNREFLECGLGTRPSFAWRSIIHGRELLKLGLIKSIGNGQSTRVWTDKWIMDKLPRTPLGPHHIDTPSMLVSDLFTPRTCTWDVEKVLQTFTERDAAFVLKQKTSPRLADVCIWSLSKDGVYNSQSGYRLLDSLPENQHVPISSLSPLEKTLWSQIWKLDTMPKIRHFFWRALSGALAVAARLRTKGVMIDPICKVCGREAETICHTLFTCSYAHQAWSGSGVPLPSNGFSRNSVFLNLYHLVKMSRKQDVAVQVRQAIRWLLWLIWKARNKLVFENIQKDSAGIILKAKEDTDIWIHTRLTERNHNIQLGVSRSQPESWSIPALDTLKCNVSCSWINKNRNCGVAWLIRNHLGQVLFHGRRSFSMIHSQQEAEVQGILWAMECAHIARHQRIVFEVSDDAAIQAVLEPLKFPMFRHLQDDIYKVFDVFADWELKFKEASTNTTAKQIATSVTRDHHYQSYSSIGGPSWLHHDIEKEAAKALRH